MAGETARVIAAGLLREWLFQRVDAANQDWLTGQLALLTGQRCAHGDRSLHIAFGMVPRRFGKAGLVLSTEDLAAADGCIPGWSPGTWSLADAGRILLLATLPGKAPDFAPRFRALCQTAELAEAISLYRGLPLYPEPETLEPLVGEGLRSNMRSVFEAIAYDNPYPRRFFETHRWNHMVLKALFIGSRLAPIQGLDERANSELARIMLDFAHERWAAGREVPYEIWRCIGPFAQSIMLPDLERALSSGTPIEQRAVALALSASSDPAAAELLRRVPALAADIASGELSWALLR
jgi:hypothetical protein